jgi:hypothetical protein
MERIRIRDGKNSDPGTAALLVFTLNNRSFVQVIGALSDRQFANSLRGVQEQLGQFNAYRNVEKPPKFMEKGNLEVLLFTLQSTMRSHNKVPHSAFCIFNLEDIKRKSLILNCWYQWYRTNFRPYPASENGQNLDPTSAIGRKHSIFYGYHSC